ncbi:MAG TPA: hypothetical protein VGD03_10720 [Frankiaceae bacterium]
MVTPARARPAGTTAQVAALLRLRWSLVRRRRTRIAILAVGGCYPLLLAAVVAVGLQHPLGTHEGLQLLAPTALAGFAVLTLAAPLAAGGGSELVPAAELVAFPVRPAAVSVGSLLLAPLNLAWLSQVLLVTFLLMDVGPHDVRALAGLVTAAAFVGCATAVGQALAWLFVGLRRHTWGRGLVTAGAAAVVVAAVLLAPAGLSRTLDRLPTVKLVDAVAGLGSGQWGRWAERTAIVLALTVVALAAGNRLCAWYLRSAAVPARPPRAVRRAGGRHSAAPAAALRRMDRTVLWRSPPLRRGLLILVAVPAGSVLVAGSGSGTAALLPGLVAAGAALLFGVNAFCLDATATPWLASLPVDPALRLRCRAQTVLLSVGGPMAATLAAVALGPLLRGAPGLSGAQLVTAATAGIAVTGWVTATCLHLSVGRPHRAELLEPRDTPAPPGALAAYSVRLSVAATLLGLGFTGAGRAGPVWLPLVCAVPCACRVAYRVRRTALAWADPAVRGRVAVTVATG